MQTELLKIDSAPARIGANFQEVQERLAAELEKYDVVVTADTLPDAKKLGTELNQLAKHIDDRRKAEVANVSAPIRQFDAQMKELVVMCKDGRQKLLSQIQRFEDETREKARVLLLEECQRQWDGASVEAEFRRAGIDDLVMVSALTKGGNLTAKAVREVESRVTDDKALQDRTHARLAQLESTSEWAGLSAPLTRDHVAGFLFADDTTYQAELKRIIDAEILREQEAQRRMRERIEQERREAAAPRETPAEPLKEPSFNEPGATGPGQYHNQQESASEPPHREPVEPEPGKVRITVRATFHPEVPEGASNDQIKAALMRSMEKAGIRTLAGIEIYRSQMEDA